MTDLAFMRPGWLTLSPLLVIALWWRWRRGDAAAHWQRICEPPLLAALGDGPIPRPGRPWTLLALAVLLPLALAEPVDRASGAALARSAYARVIVLDLSLSMLADDVAPSRLERARSVVDDLLASTWEGRTGLVVFAGIASPVTPLTSDAQALRAVLPLMHPSVLGYQGSRPDLGLEAAAELLRGGRAFGADVLLVTDGGHGARALEAARTLRDDDHRLNVLAVGTATGGRIALPGGARLQGLTGAPVRARVDGEGLRALALAGGVRFGWLDDEVEAASWAGTLAVRNAPMRIVTDAPGGNGHLGPWIVLLALVPALAALRLPARRMLRARRRRIGAALAAILVSGLAHPDTGEAADWQDLWSRPDQRAARALARGDAAGLADHRAWRWRGAGLYRDGRHDEAADAFAWGDDAGAHYNRGTALAAGGRLRDALAALDRSISLEPGHADALHNRSVVIAALAARRRSSTPTPRDHRPGGARRNAGEAGTDGRAERAGTRLHRRPGGTAPAPQAQRAGEAWFHGAGDSPGPDGVTGRRMDHETGGARSLETLEGVLLQIRDDPAELWRIKIARARRGGRVRLPERSDAW